MGLSYTEARAPRQTVARDNGIEACFVDCWKILGRVLRMAHGTTPLWEYYDEVEVEVELELKLVLVLKSVSGVAN